MAVAVADRLTWVRDLVDGFLQEIPGLHVYPTGANEVRTPAVVMELPELERVEEDSPESRFGAFDWKTRWPLRLLVDADAFARSNDAALQLMALVVAKFDANETFGDPVDFEVTCRILSCAAPDDPQQGDSKAVVAYEMTLSVKQLV